MENPQNARAVAPASPPVPIIPRYHLPDEWSGKGACPVCRTPGQLSVQHQDVTPDRMLCGACGTAFEVETAGPRIRLAAAPPAVAARTAGLLNAWLTPAELLLLLERAAASVAGSPFEPLGAAVAAGLPQASPGAPAAAASPAVSGQSKAPTAPLAPPSTSQSRGEPEAEPGTEDWFASLAAVIGGTLPIKPPPDAVLADELERVLLARPTNGGKAEVGTGLAPVLVGDPAASAEANLGAALSPSAAPGPAAPEMIKPSEAKTPEVVLAEAMAELARAGAPSASPPITAAAAAPAPETPATMSGVPSIAQPPPAVLPPAAPPAVAAAAPPGATPAPETTALVPAGTTTLVAPAALPVASRRELAERAWKLHELGNSLASIQLTMESSGGTPEDVRIIMAKLIALEQARQARFRRTVQWGAAGAAGVILVLLIIAILLGSRGAPAAPARATAAGAVVSTPGPGSTASSGTSVPGQAAATATLAYNPIVAFLNQILPGDVKIANGPSPTPAPTSSLLGALFPATATLSPQDLATGEAKKGGLPAWVATLVPNGVTVINVPTPSVDPSGPPISPCPTTSDQASALFGGPAASWTFNHQQQGWIFIIADKPTSIRVPAGMSAGYLVIGDNLAMASVLGPATVHNVNFIAVSCQ